MEENLLEEIISLFLGGGPQVASKVFIDWPVSTKPGIPLSVIFVGVSAHPNEIEKSRVIKIIFSALRRIRHT
ncbi:MAG: hypothetical protein AAF393_13530 [Pseudomonadota bacterium]